MALPVYVINMDRSQERWNRATGQLDGLNIPHTRIAATDGAMLVRNELKGNLKRKGILYRWIRDLSLSEIGCFLSHRQAWEQIARGNPHGGFVFEDDFTADPSLPAVMEAIESLQMVFSAIVKLYVPQPGEPGYYRNGCVGIVPLTDEHHLAIPKKVQWGAVAYHLNRAGASQLLDATEQFNRPVDDVIRRRWETGVAVLHVVPNPVKHSNETSVIGPMRRESESNANSYGIPYRLLFDTEFRVMNMVHHRNRGAILSSIRGHQAE